MLSRAADSRARRALRFLICLSSAAIFPGTLGPDESDSIPWRAFIGPHFYQFESISTVFGRFVLISESWRGGRAPLSRANRMAGNGAGFPVPEPRPVPEPEPGSEPRPGSRLRVRLFVCVFVYAADKHRCRPVRCRPVRCRTMVRVFRVQTGDSVNETNGLGAAPRDPPPAPAEGWP